MKAMNDEYFDEFDGHGFDAEKPGKRAASGREESEDDKLRKRDKLLNRYLDDVARCEPLSDEEARELAVRHQKTGDREAAHRLGEAHQRLVIAVAREYRKRHEQNFMDLVGVGNEGLMQAVRKFDPERGKFAGYAGYWIRAYILKFLIESHSLVKIGTTSAQRKLFFGLRKEMRKLEVQGFTPDPDVIAERMNVKAGEAAEMIGRMGRDLSLDAPRHEDGESWENHLLADGPRVEDIVENLQLKALLRDMIDAMRGKGKLNEKELVILNERLYTDDPMTLESIGRKLGVSRQYASQLQSGLLKKLRRQIEEDLHDFLDDDKFGGVKRKCRA